MGSIQASWFENLCFNRGNAFFGLHNDKYIKNQTIENYRLRALIAHWRFLWVCKSNRKKSVLIGKYMRMDMQLICEYAARTVQKLA